VHPELAIEWWPVEQPIDYARNASQITDENVAKMAAILKEFGWRQAVVVDKEEVIVAGHLRRAAARKLGFTHIPVHVASDLTAAQCKAYRLADNRIAEEVERSSELIAFEISELHELGYDLELTAFDPGELASLMADGFDVPATNSAEKATGELIGNRAATEGDTPPSDEITSHIRMLQVFCPESDWERFKGNLDILERRFAVKTATDAVIKAVQFAVENVPTDNSEDPEEVTA
jgi:hypothetical protein